LPQEVVSIVFDQLRTRDKYPGQSRAFGFVFKVSTVDSETGEPILTNEYRTYATSTTISQQTAEDRLVELIENSPNYK
jgi:hypothetical protein